MNTAPHQRQREAAASPAAAGVGAAAARSRAMPRVHGAVRADPNNDTAQAAAAGTRTASQLVEFAYDTQADDLMPVVMQESYARARAGGRAAAKSASATGTTVGLSAGNRSAAAASDPGRPGAAVPARRGPRVSIGETQRAPGLATAVCCGAAAEFDYTESEDQGTSQGMYLALPHESADATESEVSYAGAPLAVTPAAAGHGGTRRGRGDISLTGTGRRTAVGTRKASRTRGGASGRPSLSNENDAAGAAAGCMPSTVRPAKRQRSAANGAGGGGSDDIFSGVSPPSQHVLSQSGAEDSPRAPAPAKAQPWGGKRGPSVSLYDPEPTSTSLTSARSRGLAASSTSRGRGRGKTVTASVAGGGGPRGTVAAVTRRAGGRVFRSISSSSSLTGSEASFAPSTSSSSSGSSISSCSSNNDSTEGSSSGNSSGSSSGSSSSNASTGSAGSRDDGFNRARGKRGVRGGRGIRGAGRGGRGVAARGRRRASVRFTGLASPSDSSDDGKVSAVPRARPRSSCTGKATGARASASAVDDEEVTGGSSASAHALRPRVRPVVTAGNGGQPRERLEASEFDFTSDRDDGGSHEIGFLPMPVDVSEVGAFESEDERDTRDRRAQPATAGTRAAARGKRKGVAAAARGCAPQLLLAPVIAQPPARPRATVMTLPYNRKLTCVPDIARMPLLRVADVLGQHITPQRLQLLAANPVELSLLRPPPAPAASRGAAASGSAAAGERSALTGGVATSAGVIAMCAQENVLPVPYDSLRTLLQEAVFRDGDTIGDASGSGVARPASGAVAGWGGAGALRRFVVVVGPAPGEIVAPAALELVEEPPGSTGRSVAQVSTVSAGAASAASGASSASRPRSVSISPEPSGPSGGGGCQQQPAGARTGTSRAPASAHGSSAPAPALAPAVSAVRSFRFVLHAWDSANGQLYYVHHGGADPQLRAAWARARSELAAKMMSLVRNGAGIGAGVATSRADGRGAVSGGARRVRSAQTAAGPRVDRSGGVVAAVAYARSGGARQPGVGAQASTELPPQPPQQAARPRPAVMLGEWVQARAGR
jgi:hypothetical protein